MRLRQMLIDWPARVVDCAWWAYVILIFGLSITAVGSAAIALVAYGFGIRLFW